MRSKFTLQGSNTYLVGTGEKRILIDTGTHLLPLWLSCLLTSPRNSAAGNPHWLNTLKKVLHAENAQVSTALITHWHHDHVGGVDLLRSISPNTVFYKNDPCQGQDNIADGQAFTVKGATLTAYHTPGHTVDHMCFFFHEESALFTGDNVLGHGTSVFEDLATYMSSLRKMNRIPGLTGQGYPGHGEVLEDVKFTVNAYIAHREVRERQVLTVLKEGYQLHDDGGMTAMKIVEVIYKDVSRELWPAAEKGVLQILAKLEAEKKVMRKGDRWL